MAKQTFIQSLKEAITSTSAKTATVIGTAILAASIMLTHTPISSQTQIRTEHLEKTIRLEITKENINSIKNFTRLNQEATSLLESFPPHGDKMTVLHGFPTKNGEIAGRLEIDDSIELGKLTAGDEIRLILSKQFFDENKNMGELLRDKNANQMQVFENILAELQSMETN